jgi:hypothetical protein
MQTDHMQAGTFLSMPHVTMQWHMPQPLNLPRQTDSSMQPLHMAHHLNTGAAVQLAMVQWGFTLSGLALRLLMLSPMQCWLAHHSCLPSVSAVQLKVHQTCTVGPPLGAGVVLVAGSIHAAQSGACMHAGVLVIACSFAAYACPQLLLLPSASKHICSTSCCCLQPSCVRRLPQQ